MNEIKNLILAGFEEALAHSVQRLWAGYDGNDAVIASALSDLHRRADGFMALIENEFPEGLDGHAVLSVVRPTLTLEGHFAAIREMEDRLMDPETFKPAFREYAAKEVLAKDPEMMPLLDEYLTDEFIDGVLEQVRSVLAVSKKPE